MKIGIFKRCFLSVVAGVFIAGCDILVQTEIPISKVQSKDVSLQNANLYIEVASCTSYEDSRLESNSLIDAKKEIPAIFKNAEFKECFKVKMNSFAMFKIPVYMGSAVFDSKFNELGGEAEIKIGQAHDGAIVASVSNELKTKIEKSRKKNMQTYKLNTSFKLINDTGADIESVESHNVYINDVAYLSATTKMRAGQTAVVTLSDVSNNVLMQKDGYAVVGIIK